jgi:hypothetical protein
VCVKVTREGKPDSSRAEDGKGLRKVCVYTRTASLSACAWHVLTSSLTRRLARSQKKKVSAAALIGVVTIGETPERAQPIDFAGRQAPTASLIACVYLWYVLEYTLPACGYAGGAPTASLRARVSYVLEEALRRAALGWRRLNSALREP